MLFYVSHNGQPSGRASDFYREENDANQAAMDRNLKAAEQELEVKYQVCEIEEKDIGDPKAKIR